MSKISRLNIYPIKENPEPLDFVIGTCNATKRTHNFRREDFININPNDAIALSDIITEQFIYNGANNTFNLTDTAAKVLNVYIDNGTYPDQVPAGAVNDVTVDPALILNGNIINVQYIKA